MKRLRCVLFRSSLVLTTAYCVAVAALGVRSFWTQDNLVANHASGRSLWIRTERGALIVWYQRYIGPIPGQPRFHLRYLREAELPAEALPSRLLEPSWFGFDFVIATPSPFENALKEVAEVRAWIERQAEPIESHRQHLEGAILYRDARMKSDYGMEFNQWLRKENRRISDLRSEQESWENRLAHFREELSLLETQRHTERQMSISMVPLLLGVVWVPAVRVVRYIRIQRRRKLGQCTACGYDLRATPERCPECGAMPKG